MYKYEGIHRHFNNGKCCYNICHNYVQLSLRRSFTLPCKFLIFNQFAGIHFHARMKNTPAATPPILAMIQNAKEKCRSLVFMFSIVEKMMHPIKLKPPVRKSKIIKRVTQYINCGAEYVWHSGPLEKIPVFCEVCFAHLYVFLYFFVSCFLSFDLFSFFCLGIVSFSLTFLAWIPYVLNTL